LFEKSRRRDFGNRVQESFLHFFLPLTYHREVFKQALLPLDAQDFLLAFGVGQKTVREAEAFVPVLFAAPA
jgi:hypothetical protein